MFTLSKLSIPFAPRDIKIVQFIPVMTTQDFIAKTSIYLDLNFLVPSKSQLVIVETMLLFCFFVEMMSFMFIAMFEFNQTIQNSTSLDSFWIGGKNRHIFEVSSLFDCF